MNVSKVNKMYMKLQVNIILIGFQGDGHLKLDVPEETFGSWFEHISHKKPHVVVPLGEGKQATLFCMC